MRGDLEKIGKEIGVELEVEDLRKVRTGKEKKGEMVIVKVKSEECRKKVPENKKKLRGRKVWIEEDLTFQERKMKFKLRKIAEEEEW